MSRVGSPEGLGSLVVSLVQISLRPGAFVPGGLGSVTRKTLKDLVRGTQLPVVVRRVGDKYELIAGDSIYLAAGHQRRDSLEVSVVAMEDKDALLLRLLEGGKRGDLNAVEEAEIMRELNREHGLTQQEIAVRCDKVQSTVANKMRLLKLPKEVLESLRRGEIGERHARALLKVASYEKQMSIFRRCLKSGLPAGDVEAMCTAAAGAASRSRQKGSRLGVVKDPRIYQNALRGVVVEMQKAGLTATSEEESGDTRWEFRVCLTVSES